MILVAVEAAFQPADVAAALAVIDDQAGAVRSFAGCQHYQTYRSGEGLCIVQHWDSRAHFSDYLASPTFAALGAALKPMMTAPPVTKVGSVESDG